MSDKTRALVSLLLALGLLAGAGYFYSDTRRLMATAEKAQGTVVDFERRSSKGGHSDYPVIEFATVSGEVRRFTTSGAGQYAKGEAVEVLYDAREPANARVNAFIELWLGCLALGGFGLLCLAVGIANLLVYRRSGRTSR